MRDAVGTERFTAADAYRTVTSLFMVAAGVIMLARTLPSGVHVQALLAGLGFVALGAYRLSFVTAYLLRSRRIPP